MSDEILMFLEVAQLAQSCATVAFASAFKTKVVSLDRERLAGVRKTAWQANAHKAAETLP